MFIDEVIMEVEAGRGGDGCMAFLREKYISMGGPNGGNGGKGASIIFKADEGLKTLIDLRYMKNIKGAPGKNGEGKNKNGSYAEDKIIKVPVGTTVKDFDTDLVIADLTKHNIFKIVDEKKRRAFVTEEFKRAVEENQLTGFKFKLVWDSDEE